MKPAIHNVIALLAGLVGIFLAQYMITYVWSIADVYWGPKNMPVLPLQQLAMLTTTFIAGVVGPILAIMICRKIPWIVLIVMCIVGLTIDGYAALYPLNELSAWFRIVFIMSVPVQILVGTYSGILLLSLQREKSAVS